jgi:hypothetical protein
VSSNPATAAEPRSKQPICIRFSVASLFPNGPNWAGREGDYLACLRLTLCYRPIQRQLVDALRGFIGQPITEVAPAAILDIRRRIREESFFRQLMPSLQIGNEELDRQVDTEGTPPAAITVPFATLPTADFIEMPWRIASPADEIEIAADSAEPRATAIGLTVRFGNSFGIVTGVSSDGRTARITTTQTIIAESPGRFSVNSPPPTNLRTTRRGDGVLIQWDHPDPTSYTFHVHIAYDESDWQEVGRTANTEILDDDPPLGWAQYRVIAIPYEGVPDEVSFDYERSSVTHEPIWLEQTAGEILQDLVLERCRAMCPMVSEFSYRAVQERNLMIQRLAQTVVDQRLLVDTFRNAMANPPPGWQITGEHFGRPVPGGIP